MQTRHSNSSHALFTVHQLLVCVAHYSLSGSLSDHPSNFPSPPSPQQPEQSTTIDRPEPIHPSTYLYIQSTHTHPSIRLPKVHLLAHPLIYPSHVYIFSSPFMWPSIHLFIYPATHPGTYIYTCPCIHLLTPVPIHPIVYSHTHWATCLQPSTHPCTHTYTYLGVYWPTCALNPLSMSVSVFIFNRYHIYVPRLSKVHRRV